MSASRKGLRRAGMRAYEVSGPHGRFEIERESPTRWRVRPMGFPRAFFNEQFKRLHLARLAAESWAGAIPYFMDRRPG